MTNNEDAPDSDAERHDSITVFDTPERDNPKFGSVSVAFQKGLHGSTIRMTRDDAQKLNALLTDYLQAIALWEQTA